MKYSDVGKYGNNRLKKLRRRRIVALIMCGILSSSISGGVVYFYKDQIQERINEAL